MFKLYNRNPHNEKLSDCVCRAISLATGASYYDVMELLRLNSDGHECEELCVDCYGKMIDEIGYKREEIIEGIGQFSVRGGIVDIYPPGVENPVRIEFWGDEIDRINTFDIESQRRLDQIKKVHISPVKEVLFTDTTAPFIALPEVSETATFNL